MRTLTLAAEWHLSFQSLIPAHERENIELLMSNVKQFHTTAMLAALPLKGVNIKGGGKRDCGSQISLKSTKQVQI